VNDFAVLQARRHERRGHMAQRWTSSAVRAWKRISDAGVSAHRRAVTAPDQVLPALPGPHGQHWTRRSNGDRRVPVAVSLSALELQHGRGQLRLRTGHRPRYFARTLRNN